MSPFQANTGPSQTPVVLGLSTSGIAWLQPNPVGVSYWHNIIFEPDASASTAMAALTKVSEQLPWPASSPIAVVMAPSLAHHWVQTPPAQTASLAELHAITRARADLLFGNPAGVQWNIAGEWHADQPFLCACVPAAWTRVVETLGKNRRQAMTMSPLTLALSRFDKQLPKDGWIAILVAGVLHLTHRIHCRLTTLRSVRMQAQTTPAQAAALAEREWQREMLRTQKVSTELFWLSIMPYGQHTPESPALRAIPWAPLAEVPLPELRHSAPLTDHPGPAVHEAVLTAWCCQQLLAGWTA